MSLSITTHGYIVVTLDGAFISRHRIETEALESILTHAEKRGGLYEITYPSKTVKVYGTIAPGGGDTTAPTTPLNVAEVTHSATTATISWDASTDDVGVSGYQVFKDGLPVDTTADLSYQFTGLTPSTSYSFTVAAYDAAGNYSGESSAVVIVTSANAAPSWSVGQQELTTYTAYYLDLTSVCSDADGNPLTFSVVTGTLPSGVTFDSVAKTVAGTPTAVGSGAVTFRASDGITTTEQAITFNVLDADATAPSVPAGLTATPVSSSQINLSWSASTDSAGTNERATGVASYRVYRDGSLRTTVTAPTVAYNDTGLSASTSYSYTVSAVDAAGNASAQSSAVAAQTSASGGWQLASGHFIPAKMAPNIIHPRTDAEMNAYARACRCPSGIEWSIPISVQGGAWPFYYELVSGPSGMTIGSTLPGDWLTNGLQNYGVITWSNPTVGNHAISVRVTDQDGTVATRSWTLEVIDRENTAYFIFVAASGGSNSNSGSYSSPKADITGWYGSAYNVSTYPGRQVFYRAGTYTIPSAAVIDYKFDVRASYGKPVVFVAYPGEAVTIDNGAFPGCMYEMANHFTGDVCFHGIRWVNPQAWANIYGTYTNYRKCFLRIATSSARTLFFRNEFDGGGDTRADDSTNSTAIFFTGGTGNYHAVVHNEFYNCDGMDTVLLYDNQDNLFEGNLISGTYGGSYTSKPWGYFIKGSTDNGSGVRRISVRANRHDGTAKDRQLVFCSEYTGHYKGEIEVCWNNYYGVGSFTENGVAGSGGYGIGQGAGSAGTTYGNFWSYRNNWRGAHMSVITFQSGTITFENDVIQHDGLYTDGISVYNSTGSTMTKTNLASGTSAVITLDASTNLLTGAARTSYLGTHGCEVA